MSYAHTVETLVPTDVWDEAYFSMMSLKMHLQSMPGWQGMQVAATNRSARGVEIRVTTLWEDLGPTGVWAKSTRTPDAVLRSLMSAPHHINVTLSEVLS